MYLSKLTIKNLRCFSERSFEFGSHITLIEGLNGSGKSTIVEALYYLCYLRSFRTGLTQELIQFSTSSFFMQADLDEEPGHHKETLQVGFSPSRRLVKFNDQNVSSFKQLIQVYRAVVLTEDDLELIKGGPEVRRNFIDQYIYLQDPGWTTEMRHYRKALDQRNALLKNNYQKEHYSLWTDLIQQKSDLIRIKRKEALREIELEVNKQLKEHFNDSLSLAFQYCEKDWHPDLELRERSLGRSLFGCHLDDILINISEYSGRKYASRGQQKLLIVLMRAVQVILLKKRFSGAILLLLDDFITDLDDQNSVILLHFLEKLGAQLIFTTPNCGNRRPEVWNLLLARQTHLIQL